MRALWFLTVHTFKNGVVRAFSNFRRVVGLLFFVGYYVLVFIRPFERGSSVDASRWAARVPLTLPPAELIAPWVFAIFAGVSALLSMGLLSYKGTFRPADVDVLFPTPVSPRVVLLYRIFRDYALTLLLPLFLLVIGFRPAATGFEAFVRNFPQYGVYLPRALIGAWLLMALAWTTLGYACSLFVNRSDRDSGRNRIWLGLLAYGPPIGLALFLTLALRDSLTIESARQALDSPFAHVLFVPAWAASAIVMAPISGNLLAGLLGVLSLLAIIGVSIVVALRQVTWMYDQAAARGFDAFTLAQMRRRGDFTAIRAEQARQGKLKAGRVSRWLARRTVRGGRALLWREAILQARSNLWAVLVISLAVTGFGAALAQGIGSTSGRVEAAGYAYLAFQMYLLLLLGISMAQQAFVETLRRGDVLKPLPFSPHRLVFAEVAGKALPSSLATGLFGLFALPFVPHLWDEVISGIVLFPSFALPLTASGFLVTVLFPDLDDPTQRGFRSLVAVLSVLIVASPGLAIAVGLIAFKVPVYLATLPVAGVNLAITFGVAVLAGNLYAQYNPSE